MRKNTKKALILSCLSLLLCVSMLVGTTFAWFTDNESVSVSKIEAGTLDIELYKVDYSSSLDVTGTATKITDSKEPIFDYAMWEPGYVQFVNIRVENVGTLAAKWQATLASSEVGKLAEVIEVYVSDIAVAKGDITFVGTLDDRELVFNGYNATYVGMLDDIVANGTPIFDSVKYEGSTCDSFGVLLKMQETAGNIYQGKEAGTFDIRIQATQDTVEEDSFDNQYDAGAEYDKLVNVRNQTELNEAVANATEPVNLVLSGDTYTLPDLTNKTVTFSGVENTVIDTTAGKGSTSGASLTFEGVTVKFKADGSYDGNGFTHAKAVTYKDCVIEGQQFLYAPNNTFINCTFKNSGDNYNVWTYGTNTTFTDCTFNCDGKAVLIYTEAQVTASYTFTDCTFNDGGSISGKAAIEVAESAYGNKANYTINVNNCTVNGFGVTTQNSSTFGGNDLGTSVWGNKNLIPADRLNVFINGTEVY